MASQGHKIKERAVPTCTTRVSQPAR